MIRIDKTMCRFILILLFLPALTHAFDQAPIPHVSRKAQDSFQFDYQYADQHKAFAIAPGGAWSWVSGKESTDQAKQAAMAACANYTLQKCHLYAVDDKLTFDKEEWFALWGPYKTAAQAQKAEVGTRPGDKFPDLVFTDPEGRIRSIGDLKGKVVFVHIWGCWCPSCRYEFQSLINMYSILRDTLKDDVYFAVLQAREPIATARKWARENKLEALPLSDSGVKSSKDRQLTLRGGGKIDDRELARAFPASYVLDRNGLVVFSHMGSISDWSQYTPFFMDAARKSGR